MGEEHYKSREFCRDIGCEVQQELDKYEKENPMYEVRKTECVGNCRYTREDFMIWLNSNGYTLKGKTDEIFASGTAHQFHEWLQKHGVEIAKKG
ncbi:hypothetical protein JW898_01755 [Candidatus Woesearchaeota archaeon]|nr:hypothetical protein [Candidatus Woesearchaeota archaeon]